MVKPVSLLTSNMQFESQMFNSTRFDSMDPCSALGILFGSGEHDLCCKFPTGGLRYYNTPDSQKCNHTVGISTKSV